MIWFICSVLSVAFLVWGLYTFFRKKRNYLRVLYCLTALFFNILHWIPNLPEDASKKVASQFDGSKDAMDKLRKKIANNKKERNNRLRELLGKEWDVSKLPDDNCEYVENQSSLFEIPVMFYCSLPNSGRYISEITAMVEAVIDVFREEYSKWEKEEDAKFVLCTRLTDELNLLKRNYEYYYNYMNAPKASDNVVIDVIQRKIRDVILSAPEPEDYQTLLDMVAKEFKDSENG